MSWAYLYRCLELWKIIAEGRILFESGDTEGAQKKYDECCKYVIAVEDEVQRGFDGYQYVNDILKGRRLGLINKY